MDINKTVQIFNKTDNTIDTNDTNLIIINLPSIDWNVSLKLSLGKKKLAKNLHEMMINNLPKEQTLINLAFNQQRLDDLREYIHKLYGGCCYTGFIKLKYLAKNLEQEIVNIKNQHKINQSKIKQYINLINQEINFLLTQQFEIQNL